MKIILVDDDPLALEGISRILHWERFDGCLAGCAADGREAVALLEREHPDVVISDIRMPDIYNRIVVAKMTVCEDWICLMAGKRLCQAFTAGNRNCMVVSGSGLGYQKIVIAVFLVDMWSLRPFYAAESTMPCRVTFADKFHRI